MVLQHDLWVVPVAQRQIALLHHDHWIEKAVATSQVGKHRCRDHGARGEVLSGLTVLWEVALFGGGYGDVSESFWIELLPSDLQVVF